MIKDLGSLAAGLLLAASPGPAVAEVVPDTRFYEMRRYHAAPGKLDALLSRFRDHTCGLLAKHGMTQIGYWVPVDNPGQLLICLLAYPDRCARVAAWRGFLADPEWTKAQAASEVDGKLVAKVDEWFLSATDFSPGFPASASPARLFEMRTYTAAPDKLPELHRRFRDHTLGLFARHGMTSAGYYRPVAGQRGEDDSLLYFLAHSDATAAASSWTAFRADPDWVAAKQASETAAGGSLTLPDGVRSVFLKPVDFSPVK
jgi:hypothetical protein